MLPTPALRHASTGPYVHRAHVAAFPQRIAEGVDRLLQPRHAALAFPKHLKRVAEVVLIRAFFVRRSRKPERSSPNSNRRDQVNGFRHNGRGGPLHRRLSASVPSGAPHAKPGFAFVGKPFCIRKRLIDNVAEIPLCPSAGDFLLINKAVASFGVSLTSCIIAHIWTFWPAPLMLLTKPCPDAQYDQTAKPRRRLPCNSPVQSSSHLSSRTFRRPERPARGEGAARRIAARGSKCKLGYRAARSPSSAIIAGTTMEDAAAATVSAGPGDGQLAAGFRFALFHGFRVNRDR